MRKGLRILVVSFLVFGLAGVCLAEKIYLKSGRVFEGAIVENTEEYIKVQEKDVPLPLTYYRDQIERIEKSATPSVQAPEVKKPPVKAAEVKKPVEARESPAAGELSKVYQNYLEAVAKKSFDDLKKYMPAKDMADMERDAAALGGMDNIFQMIMMMSPKDLKNVTEAISGDTGELKGVAPGMFGGEAQVTISFGQEDGKWKITNISSSESN